MPTRRQRAYARKLDEILKQTDRLENGTIRLFIRHLQDLRKEIAGILTGINPDTFEAFRLQQLQAQMGAAIDQFNSALTRSVADSVGNIYELGERSVFEPLIAAGIGNLSFIPNIQQLNVITGFSTDLIRNISEPMRQQINTQLRLALVGGQSPFKAMQSITDILGVKARDGVWGLRRRPEVVKGVAARGEAIFRTEATRAFGLAAHSQQQELAQQDDQIRKAWVATGDGLTRLSHLNAHLQYNSDPIPVDEPFIVGGAELRFPGDPLGPAAETINCRCRQITIHLEIGTIHTPLDASVAAEKERRA